MTHLRVFWREVWRDVRENPRRVIFGDLLLNPDFLVLALATLGSLGVIALVIVWLQ